MKQALIIDDSSMIRKVTRMILERLNFEVMEAESGQQALNMCRKSKPDLILVDWNMPQMSGPEFLNTYAAQVVGKKPPVIYCATEYIESNINQALQAGADSILMKPYDLAAMREKIGELGLVA